MPVNAQNLETGPERPGPRLADPLEVREGASRYSADFFHTRNSTWASPTAAFGSSTSASNCSSRAEAPRPAGGQNRPPGLRNCAFHFATLCLGHLIAPSRLADRHLAGQHGQHDPGLLLYRGHCRTAHQTVLQLRDSTNPWARTSDARHD
jgi:hypothetical protein